MWYANEFAGLRTSQIMIKIANLAKLTAAIVGVCWAATSGSYAAQPNIVLVMADDQGLGRD
jgi:hypothetical protein